ncbi:uncharacterized protein METZ01_LOCUS222646, partial [marine metagenome]
HLKDSFEYASKEARIAIVICDQGIRNIIDVEMDPLIEGKEDRVGALEQFETEKFDITTIKGLERPVVIVIGGWMVSLEGEHSHIFSANQKFEGGANPPILEPGEIDRINRRMLIALSRATETSVILVPPTGCKREPTPPMFDRQRNSFVQLPYPKGFDELVEQNSFTGDLSVFTSGSLQQIPEALHESHRALLGLEEGIKFMRRAETGGELKKEQLFNRLRVMRLITSEIDSVNDATSPKPGEYLLTRLFLELDGVQSLHSSSLFHFLLYDLYDFEPNEPRIIGSFDKLKDKDRFEDSNNYALFSAIDDPTVVAWQNESNIGTLVELLRFANVQNSIFKAINSFGGKMELPKDLDGVSKQEIHSAEGKIRAELCRAVEQLTSAESNRYADIPRGIVEQLGTSPVKGSVENSIEKKAIQEVMTFFNTYCARTSRPRFKIDWSDTSSYKARETFHANLLGIWEVILDKIPASGKLPQPIEKILGSIELTTFHTFMDNQEKFLQDNAST